MENAGEMHILIVEDEKDTAAVLKLLLKTKLHASSEIAPDCASARQSLASNSYDLITMDYQLPDGDGLSLFEEIVGKENAPPVVMVTGHGDEQTAVSAFKLGASGYVVKDARMSTMLVEEARSALARAGQAEEELRESEERFRTIVENAPFGYYRVGKDGLWQYVNPVWERMHEISLEEVIGKPFEITQPEDAVEQARELVSLALAGEAIAGEFSRLTRKGDVKYHRFNIQPVKHGNEIVAIEGFIDDITERKHIEASLRERETRLRAITDGAMDAIILIDNKTIIRHWNPAAENLYGFTAEEAIGQSVAFIYPEPRRQAYISALERFLLSGDRTFTREEPSEMSFTGKHRAEFPAEVSISRLRIGDEWYAEIIARDITGRKGAEDRLKERERELSRANALLEETGRMAGMGGWEFDVDTGKQVWTPEVYRIHEVDLDFEPTVEKGISFYAPESVPIISEAVQLSIEEGEPFDVELRFITAKGNERWVHAIGEAERVGGQTVKVRGAFQDVTDRKAAEEALRLTQFAVDQSADSVFWVTSEGKIIYANEEACRRRGYTREEMLSLEIFDINDSMAADPVLWESTRERIQQEGHFTVEFRHRTKGGEVFPVEAALNFFDLEGGWLFVANVRDITDRKQAEEALRLANMELEGYAHTVSHDLQGPLSSIATAADLLSSMLEGIGDDEGEALGIIRNSVKRALDLTENLLGLAEVGQAPPLREPLDVSEVVRSILLEKEALLKERGTRVSLEGDLGVAAMDPTHAYQVFSNLIGNAIKHNDSENLEIHVSRLEETESGVLRYLVRDNGPGIPEGAEEDIFLPFHKGPNSTDTGIGLSTVDKVVRLYGGTIWAYNDGGACFEFTLPMQSL